MSSARDAVGQVDRVPEDVEECARTPCAEMGVGEYENGAHRELLMESTWRGIAVGSK